MASVFPKECGGVEGQLKGLNMYLVGRANGNSGFSLLFLFPFIFTLVSHFICCLLSSTRFPAACCCLPCALLNQINQVLARLPPLGAASLSCPARMDAVVCSLSRCSLFPSLPAVLSRLAPLAWRVKGAPFTTSTLIYLHIFTILHFIIQECNLSECCSCCCTFLCCVYVMCVYVIWVAGY